ncbi:hypothetical protein FOZ63_014604, partial [Perkinsus olseni]
PTPSEKNKSPTENGSISEEGRKREGNKSEGVTEEQTANLESETQTSLKQAEVEESHQSQQRKSTSQDEETETKENKASQQRLDRQESDESSDFEFLDPEEEEKARRKMGIRYEIKRKLINYKNKRRDIPKHDAPDDIGERHLLQRSVSVPATNLRRSTKVADSTIRRHSR